jgi:hypothetical protein
MGTKFKLQPILLTGLAAGEPLHPGDNSVNYPSHAAAFALQAQGDDVIIGDAASVALDVGFELPNASSVGWGNQESRGTDVSFDLTSIYVKSATGSVLLMLEVPAD